MPRARPGARKTSARRRIHRYRTKWTHHVIPLRIKKLLDHMEDEWEDEDKGNAPVFAECEEPTMAELTVKGVPKAEWPYYLGYMKRMLALYRAYTGETLQLEKTSLIEEYVLREKDRHVLEQVQEVAAECAGFPPVPPFTCEDVKACLEGDYSAWGVYDRFLDPQVSGGKGRQGALVNGAETEILLMDEWALQAKRYTIATKALAVLAGVDHDWPRLFTVPNGVRAYSVLGTYAVALIFNCNGIRIYKNGAIAQTLTPAQLGMDATDVETVDISASGKYVIVSGELTAEGGPGWVVLEGS